MTAAILQLAGQLSRRRETLAVAESCTGGLLAGELTKVAGSSAWFGFGWVTYSNTAKQQQLGVSADTLAAFGAVSAPVVQEMAVGARRAAGADYALSISGIAGPGGGSAEKPVGTVWFGLASPQGVAARQARFEGNRDEVRTQAVAFAVNWLAETVGAAE